MARHLADRFLPHSISRRLLFLILVVLVPVLLSDAWIYYSRYEASRDGAFQANLELARAVGTTFEAYVNDVVHQELAIGLTFASPQTQFTEQGTKLLAANSAEYSSLREFSWIDPRGRVLASSNPAVVGVDASDRVYFQQLVAGREWVVSDLVQARVGGEPVFAIGRAVRDGAGNLQGVVLATVLPQQLNSVLHVERAGEAAVLLVDSQGLLAFRFPEANPTWEQRGKYAAIPLVGSALTGKGLVGSYVSPLTGDQRIAGLIPVQGIGWVAVASRPQADVMARIDRDMLYSSGLLLLVILVGLLVSMQIGRAITEPVRHLREYVLALAHGDFGHRIEVTGPGEVAEVVAASTLMADEIQLRERLLRESEERLRLVVANSPDTIFYEDSNLRYSWVGSVALPLTEKQMLGKTDFELFSNEEAQRLSDIEHKVLETGAGARAELCLSLGGQKRYYDAVYVPRRDQGGRVVGIFGYVHDITDRTELDRLKDDFIAVAAHELKTPVAIIKGYSQALLRRAEEVAPQGRRMLEAIDRGSDRITNVVQDLLDISKLHAGRLDLVLEPIDLPALVAEVTNRKSLTVVKHSIRVVKAEPVVVHGDRYRLEQVLLNLLDNAVKYSPAGGNVDVAVAVQGNEAVVSVRDYGVGIPREKQERIFQRFYSAHTGTPNDYGGMGVGLYISKEIITRHCGKMWFESEESKGSAFYFSLPSM